MLVFLQSAEGTDCCSIALEINNDNFIKVVGLKEKKEFTVKVWTTNNGAATVIHFNEKDAQSEIKKILSAVYDENLATEIAEQFKFFSEND